MKRKSELTVNLSGPWKQKNGEMVAPAILMTAGVRCGSHGCLLWESSVLRNSASAWDGVAVTLDHPQQDGKPVSINSSDTIKERFKIGRVKNARFAQGALCAELAVNSSAARFIVQNCQEVSIGAFTEEVEEPGRIGDRAFIGKVKSATHDHVAVLSQAAGACSWEDGCGIRANERNKEVLEQALKEILAERKGGFEMENEILLPPEVAANQETKSEPDQQVADEDQGAGEVLLPTSIG